MKLVEKYNRLNITATILTFVIGSCAFYFLLHYILISQVDESLRTEQQEVISYVNTHNTLPEIIETRGQHTYYQPSDAKVNTAFRYVPNGLGKNEGELREIRFTVAAGGKSFLVTVDKPLEETEALLKVIIGVTVAMIAIILLAGYLINRVVLRRLWKPFYQTIGAIKTYHLSEQGTLNLSDSDIDEFSLLNRSINEMTTRIQHDYSSLQNFTGQAAHEMQTPLAVIRTRLDNMMQNEAALEKNGQHLEDIEKAVHRLSRLHQSLLLLTRVENRQFLLNEEVNIARVIEDKCIEYSDMADALKLTIDCNAEPVTVRFHQQLADMLAGNLLSNAIRYNHPGGKIKISLKDNRLTVSNTSGRPRLADDKVFKRFYRESGTEDGTGLGLSIVKQICDLAGFSVRYRYEDSWHEFTVTFKG